MSKKLSENDRMQAYGIAAMYEVMDLLGWDIGRYTTYKYECGLSYLWERLRSDPDGFARLSGNELFWMWWKNHWYLRESEWLRFCRRAYCKPDLYSALGTQFGRRTTYLVMNNPYELARGKTINSRQLEESYTRFMVPTLQQIRA